MLLKVWELVGIMFGIFVIVILFALIYTTLKALFFGKGDKDGK